MEQLPCHLLADPPMPGPVNMAIDELLLETMSSSETPALRFYSWSEPTLSLGYFQSFSDREKHQNSLSCPVVRRTTGGGAILHDCELTYSLSWPNRERPHQIKCKTTKGAEWMYEWVHQALIDVLAEMGVDATFCKATASVTTEQPFLCFERRSDWDVGLGNAKIVGSAQRSYRGGVLQHGSLLLSASAFTPHLTGLNEYGLPCSVETLRARWADEIAAKADLRLEEKQLTNAQKQASVELAEQKYGSSRWIKRR